MTVLRRNDVFNCDKCGYKSSYKYNLDTHMLQHGSKRECKVCHKLVLNMSSHLRSHVKAKCPVCNKTIVREYLVRHIKTHD